jgi:hypothetical protein
MSKQVKALRHLADDLPGNYALTADDWATIRAAADALEIAERENRVMRKALGVLVAAVHRAADEHDVRVTKIRDQYYEQRVEAIAQGAGYGAIIDSAIRLWHRQLGAQDMPTGGEFMVLACRATATHILKDARAALSLRRVGAPKPAAGKRRGK